eukprot:7602948-Karenia_brevis.AAC.1
MIPSFLLASRAPLHISPIEWALLKQRVEMRARAHFDHTGSTTGTELSDAAAAIVPHAQPDTVGDGGDAVAIIPSQ